jgi:hypothetical protein
VPTFRGRAGTILLNDIIVGAVSEWTILVRISEDTSAWMGSLIWQWFRPPDFQFDHDEFCLELNDGASTPSFELRGRTVITEVDHSQCTVAFRGTGLLEGMPDPSPGTSEISVT